MPRGQRGDGRSEERENSSDPSNRLSARETLILIFKTYVASFPYLLIFLAGLLLFTWIITELVL